MPESNPQFVPESPARRHAAWLVVPIVLALTGIAAWLLAACAHAPILATWLVIATIGWLLFRYGRANALAITVLVVAVAMLSVQSFAPISANVSWASIVRFLGTAGAFLLLLAGTFFFVASIGNRSQCAGNCAGCMTVFFTIVIFGLSGFAEHERRVHDETIQATRELILTLHRLSAEIETIRSRLGRLPDNEGELVDLRGEQMPLFYKDFHITYRRDDRNGYSLNCCVGNVWGHGWGEIIDFHGPESTQRISVVPF